MSLITFQVQAKKCCFCETGNYPENQIGFFEMGCNIWLGSQNDCDETQIVPYYHTKYEDMKLSCQGGEVAIGYVGHWGSSSELVYYLNSIVLPAMKTHDVSVYVDNTACSAMNHPEIVQDAVRNIASEVNKELIVQGNQVLSIGKWDVVAGGSSNFSAIASSNSESVIYPSCSNYRDKPCFSGIQNGQTGQCEEKNGHLTELVCCETEIDNHQMFIKETMYLWSERRNCT